MNHRISPLLVAVLALLLTRSISAAAAPVDVLLDPHAGSAEKREAVGYLARLGALAGYAAPALARQSLYDMPQTRELALQTLVKLVGEEEAKRLRTLAARREATSPQDLLAKQLDTAKTWDDLPRAAFFFHDARPEFQKSAVVAAIRIWDNTHQPPPKSLGFDDWAKRDFLAVLSDLTPSLSPSGIRSATELVRAMHVDGPDAVPLLLAALADENPLTRALVRQEDEQVFTPNNEDPQLFGHIVIGIVQALVQPQPSVRLTATAMYRLAAMGPTAKDIAVYALLSQVIQGNSRAKPLLESWGADHTPLAKAVIALSAEPTPEERTQLAALLEAMTITPAAARNRAIQLLSADGEPLREKLATLIGAADPTRIDRHLVLFGTITLGKPQSAEVIKRLNVDPAIIIPRIAQLLKIEQSPVRQAALNVLKVTGLQGDEIGAALDPLLEDHNDDVRIAAATLLDRKDVLARMRVPAILRDLRSDTIDRRMIAARQLDDLGIEPKEITAALRRAVDRRDMPAREGLIAALEAAHTSHQKTLDILQRTADKADAAPRAYARAALREIAAAR
jgi:hypothetical protein